MSPYDVLSRLKFWVKELAEKVNKTKEVKSREGNTKEFSTEEEIWVKDKEEKPS